MPIPYARTYTAAVAGAVWKVVHCEHCKSAFAYYMERVGGATGWSMLFLDNAGAQDRAQEGALQSLTQKLDDEFDSIPCPHCGKYQDCMLRGLRLQHRTDLCIHGVWLLVLSFALFGVSYLFASNASHDANGPSYNPNVPMLKRIFLSAGFVAAGIGIAAFAVYACLAWRYDPNNSSEHDSRMEDAKLRTISGPDLTELPNETLESVLNKPQGYLDKMSKNPGAKPPS